jgi:hypothetical protein
MYTRTGETTAVSIEALVIDSSTPLGLRTNPVGPDPSVLMERKFHSPPGSTSGATGSNIPERHQTVAKCACGTRWRETGRVGPQAGAVRLGPNWRW